MLLKKVLLVSLIVNLILLKVSAATPYEKLKELKITLQPDAAPGAALAVNIKRSGNLLFVSGHLSTKDGKIIKGKLGKTMQTKEGEEAARLTAIDILSTLHNYLGSLDDITQIVKLTGFVNSGPDFYDSPLVINGASKLLLEVFEKKGEHARSSIPVVSLPDGGAVEIELIVEVKPSAPVQSSSIK